MKSQTCQLDQAEAFEVAVIVKPMHFIESNNSMSVIFFFLLVSVNELNVHFNVAVTPDNITSWYQYIINLDGIHSIFIMLSHNL